MHQHSLSKGSIVMVKQNISLGMKMKDKGNRRIKNLSLCYDNCVLNDKGATQKTLFDITRQDNKIAGQIIYFWDLKVSDMMGTRIVSEE